MNIRRRSPMISDEWRREAGRLVRELRFRDYESALRFVPVIGAVQDFGHHADVCLTQTSGGVLRVVVRNHEGAGITEQELRLASRLDVVIGEHYEDAYGAEPSTTAPATRETGELVMASARWSG